IHVKNGIILSNAAMGGHLDVVEYLIKQGADLHAGHESALRMATEWGHLNVVKWLVEHGADLSSTIFMKITDKKVKEYLERNKSEKQKAGGKYYRRNQNGGAPQEVLDQLLIDSAGDGDLKGVIEALDQGANIHA